MRHIQQRPCIGGAPAFGAREDVAETRSLQDAGVLSLEPVVEPRQRLDKRTTLKPVGMPSTLKSKARLSGCESLANPDILQFEHVSSSVH
jgi:hypothetical protein